MKIRKNIIPLLLVCALLLAGVVSASARDIPFRGLSMSALVMFDDFLSLEETEAILGENVGVTCAYLWMPGKTGRAIIEVRAGDLEGELKKFFASTAEDIRTLSHDENHRQYIADMIELMRSYGFFALEVAAPLGELIRLGHTEHVADVDYLPRGHIIPDKPDGTY